jgi:hypothetical protein
MDTRKTPSAKHAQTEPRRSAVLPVDKEDTYSQTISNSYADITYLQTTEWDFKKIDFPCSCHEGVWGIKRYSSTHS